MAYTQADLDALDASVRETGNAAGVTFGDGSGVRYVPASEVAKLREIMQRDISRAAAQAAAAAGQPLPSVRAFRGRMGTGY